MDFLAFVIFITKRWSKVIELYYLNYLSSTPTEYTISNTVLDLNSFKFQIFEILVQKFREFQRLVLAHVLHILSWTHKNYVLRIPIKFQLLLKLELIRNRIEMIETHEKKTWFLAILNFRLWESTLECV